MDNVTVESLFENTALDPNKDTFFKFIFENVLKNKINDDEFNNITSESWHFIDDIRKSTIQDADAIQYNLKTISLANSLINEKGDIDLFNLTRLIDWLEKNRFNFVPYFENNWLKQHHLLNALLFLKTDKSIPLLFKSFSKPVSNPIMEKIIRDTLHLTEETLITDIHTKRAALAAWLGYLRQSVGSCFATAPAILIYQEQSFQFLSDINELFNTGRLKKVNNGIEYTVPLSFSWGAGELNKPIYFPLYVKKIPPIWLSPTIQQALLGIGVVTPLNKIEKLKTLFLKFIGKFKNSALFTITEFFEFILLEHYKLNKSDLQALKNRPKNVFHETLIIQHASNRSKSKIHQIQLFQQNLELAKNIFKRFSENALLKSWEYTLASFSENKTGFTRWNLYRSLGFRSEEPLGIGECIASELKKLLEEENLKIQESQDEYDQVYAHIKYLETRIRSASETEAQWLKSEYQTRRNEFYTLETIRNRHHYRASALANMFNKIVHFYDQQFPYYFQEIYDPDISVEVKDIYNDSPAGFRLVYKYGRSNSAQWIMIKNGDEYIEALTNFFYQTENELTRLEELEDFENELSLIVSAILQLIRKEEFLKQAIARSKKGNPNTPNVNLNHTKPWAYDSGGTMETLISTYYKRDGNPTIISKWVENPVELLIFLLDTLKQMPLKITDLFLTQQKKFLLMHSPTHAFNLQPDQTPFKEGWMTDAFTYTWVRDEWIIPRQNFLSSIYLEEKHVTYILENLAEKVPDNVRHFFFHSIQDLYTSSRVDIFRLKLLERMQFKYGNTLRYLLSEQDIDSFLYECLPFTPKNNLKITITECIRSLPGINLKQLATLESIIENKIIPLLKNDFVSANQCQILVEGMAFALIQNVCSNYNYPLLIAKSLRRLQRAMPEPIIFADTNWPNFQFAFVVNPGTGLLDLWRVNSIGTKGFPMAEWREWLNGSRKDIPWGIYTNPFEYTFN